MKKKKTTAAKIGSDQGMAADGGVGMPNQVAAGYLNVESTPTGGSAQTCGREAARAAALAAKAEVGSRLSQASDPKD
jgi:hypothetical protein